MAKAKFMNGEFSAKFKGKRKFVAEQMEAIKDYAARDDMQINICPIIQERPSEKKNTEEQITPTHFISGNLEHVVVAIYDNAGIPSFMHRFRKVTNKELFGGSDKTNAAFIIGDEEYDEIYISAISRDTIEVALRKKSLCERRESYDTFSKLIGSVLKPVILNCSVKNRITVLVDYERTFQIG